MCWRAALASEQGTRTRSPIPRASFLSDESLHSWSFHYVRGRSTSCILATEESKNAEGRGHRTSIITACGGRRGVKWRRRQDSFPMKAGVWWGWMGRCLCCAANNTHYAAVQLRDCPSLPFFCDGHRSMVIGGKHLFFKNVLLTRSCNQSKLLFFCL